jgi:hypothetical protein
VQVWPQVTVRHRTCDWHNAHDAQAVVRHEQSVGQEPSRRLVAQLCYCSPELVRQEQVVAVEQCHKVAVDHPACAVDGGDVSCVGLAEERAPRIAVDCRGRPVRCVVDRAVVHHHARPVGIGALTDASDGVSHEPARVEGGDDHRDPGARGQRPQWKSGGVAHWRACRSYQR